MVDKLTKYAHVHSAKQVLESVSEASNNVYYVFAAKHTPYSSNNDTASNTIIQDNGQTLSQVYNDILFGKRIAQTDTSLMIPRINYVPGVMYSTYDDNATDLYNSNFYATVNAGSFYHTFKCLNNNQDALSTLAPDFSTISSNDELIISGDGYVWKYMYSVTDTDERKFATINYFPLVVNNQVTATAIPGSIDAIRVESSGFGYNNNLRGTFSIGDINVGGNNYVYGVSSNTTSSTLNGFYTGCIFKIVSGTGAGQFATIIDYIANSSARVVVLDSILTTPLSLSSVFEITPKVIISSQQKQTINCVARALINTSGNSVSSIEIINRGAGYMSANATLSANVIVGVTDQASVNPIISPYGGHGFDPASELGANRLCFSTTFANTENGTIPTYNEYRQVGIIVDPIFNQATLNLSNNFGTFFVSEIVRKINPITIYSNASINTTSSALNCAAGKFDQIINAGDYLYLNQSNTQNQLAVVNNVVNSSVLMMTSNGLFTGNTLTIALANVTANAIISTVGSNTLAVHHIRGVLSQNDRIIGSTTGSVANISSIVRSGTTKDFKTFVQMDKYVGSMISGVFQADEVVTFGNSALGMAARLYSSNNISGTGPVEVFCTNITGIITTGMNIVGQTSGAIATISTVYNSEVEFCSGRLFYLENLDPISRSNTQSEQFKLIFEY